MMDVVAPHRADEKKVMFSILIPAYKNYFLKECIDSILDQTYNCFEIIIVDDASPYNIFSIISQYDDKRIRYYRNKEGFGAFDVVGNWNKCLSYASGDYVICMGDDDKLAPNCLEDYLSLIIKYPQLQVYHTRTLIIDENSNVIRIQEQRPEYESGYSLLWHRWNGRLWQYIGDFLYKRQSLLDNGGFYKLPFAWASDDISAVRAALQGGIANTVRPGFLYRVNSQTISLSTNERLKAVATIEEKKWFSKVLLSANPTDDVDMLLLSSLKRNIDNHYREKFLLNFRNDVSLSLLRVGYWYKMRKQYDLSAKEIFKNFMKVFTIKFERVVGLV